MTERLGVGLDTAFLQGVDSRVRRLRGERGAFDPHDEVAFIHAIDAYTDTVPLLLVLPRTTPGYLAPVGQHVAGIARKQTEGERLAPLVETRGEQLYRDLFALLDHDADFLRQVVDWSWFQLFDPDVLRGYSTRMEVESMYLNTGIGQHFAAAVNADPALVGGVALSVALQTAEQYHVKNTPLRDMHDALGLRTGDTLQAVDAIEKDIDLLGDQARALSTTPLALLMLAYSGSVFRRGWQYGAVYERFTPAEAYLPQPLRSYFMRQTADETAMQPARSARVHFWSWGALLHRAVSQAPTVWADHDRLLATMDAIRKADIPTSFVWDTKTNLADELSTRAKTTPRLRDVAQDLGVLVTTDDAVQRWYDVVTWSCRLAPHFGLTGAVALLHSVLGPAAIGVELGGVTGIAYAHHRVGHRIDEFARRLSERLLSHVLRVGGESVARKIVGLDWTEDDTVRLTAQQPVVTPAHMF